MQLPSQYNRLMPCLIVPDAYAFIRFMKSVFGATEQIIVPRSAGVRMHAGLRIGESVSMLADATEECIATRELSQQPYGYTCGLKAPFGNDW